MNAERLATDVQGLRAGFLADLEVVGICTEAKLIELDCAGKLVELPGWGHGMLDVHTAELGGRVREFLDSAP